MKKRKAKKHLSKRWKKIVKHFKAFVTTQDAEALHQFRVQVKKIRSALTLLEENKKNSKLLHTLKPVKKIFKLAGTIRDAYLHQQQGKEHGFMDPQFMKTQYQLQQSETNKLLRKGNKHLHTIQKVKKKLENNTHSVSIDEIKAFYIGYLQQTQMLLQRHGFTEELHDGRKMLKHLIYNQGIAKDNNIDKELNINFNYINQLQDVIGRWHDTKLALSFFGKELATNELQAMEEKKANLQEQISNLAEDFEKKVLNEKI